MMELGVIDETNSKQPTFQSELEELINKHSQENGSDTPDFILAEYIMNCLYAFNKAVCTRTTWYSADPNDDVGIVEPKN